MEAEIINLLSDYGGLGILAIVLLFDKWAFQRKVARVIDNNNQIMSAFCEIVRKCPGIKK